MKKLSIFVILIIVSSVAAGYIFWKIGRQAPSGYEGGTAGQLKNMIKITSSAFLNGETIPRKYTCDGDDVNPPLLIGGVPSGAKSLVLIVDDPDVLSGIWNHWLVWNIDPRIKEIKENSIPSGAILGKNDFGKLEYGGPCPPRGTHRYFFKVYALDISLELDSGADGRELEQAMKGHILDHGELMGIYRR